MKVEVTKDIKNWAVHHAWGPVVNIEKGSVLDDDYPDYFKIRVIDAGYGRQVSESVIESPEVTGEVETVGNDAVSVIDTIKNELTSIVDNSRNDKKAKQKLEEYGKKHYDIDIDRRGTVSNVIDSIMDAAKEAEGT